MIPMNGFSPCDGFLAELVVIRFLGPHSKIPKIFISLEGKEGSGQFLFIVIHIKEMPLCVGNLAYLIVKVRVFSNTHKFVFLLFVSRCKHSITIIVSCSFKRVPDKFGRVSSSDEFVPKDFGMNHKILNGGTVPSQSKELTERNAVLLASRVKTTKI